MKHFTLTSIFLFTFSLAIFSQSSDDNAVESRSTQVGTNITIPSPNAASLGVYGDFPVRGFTGVPSINIPLYEVNTHGFKLPISLSYNATGVKVSDIASWVGLGWSLNSGGVITRRVVDYPDDYDPSDAFGTGYLYGNYRTTDAQAIADNPIPFTPAEFYNVGYNKYSVKNRAHLVGTRSRHFDTEPDIFYFNFGGHTGKFVFSQNGNPLSPGNCKILTVPYQDLAITYTFGQHGFIDAFKIVDENGNQYFFSAKEYVDARTYSQSFGYYNEPSSSGGIDVYHYSAWYLSKITTMVGEDINFTYASESYEEVFPTTYTVRNFPDNGYGCTSQPNGAWSYGDETFQGVRLTGIEGENFKITFNPVSESRQDLTGAQALSSIQVFSKDGTGNTVMKKEFDLGTSYLEGSETVSQTGFAGGDPNVRLMLNSITEKGVDNSEKPPYTFDYDNNLPLPSRLSKQQDFWGYYNNNGCKSSIPTLYIYPNEFDDQITVYPRVGYSGLNFTINNSDRTTNPSAALSGTIKKITYPTGGYEEFTFESNTFSYLSQDRTGGGIRLKQSKVFDGIDHAKDIVKNYDYTNNGSSSGVLFNLPVFAYKENFPNYWTPVANNIHMPPNPQVTVNEVLQGQSGEFSLTDINYYKYNLQVSETPNMSLTGYDGTNVGYAKITESSPGNGKTVRTYSTPGNYGEQLDVAYDPNGDYEDQGLGENPPSYYFCAPTGEGYCDGLFSVAKPMAWDFIGAQFNQNGSVITTDPDYTYSDFVGLDVFAHSPYTNPVNTTNTYPFAPKMNYDWNRGLLTSEKVFREDNFLLNETATSYQLFTPKNVGPSYVYGLKKGRMSNYRLVLSNTYPAPVIPLYDIVTEYPVIANVTKLPYQSTTKSYDPGPNSGGNMIESITTFFYGGNHIMPIRTERQDSKGETVKSFATYPMDYTIGTNASDAITLGILDLQNRHFISPAVENYVQKSDATGTAFKTVKASLVQYNYSIPTPNTIFKLETNTPLSDFTPLQITSGSSTIDPRYKAAVLMNSYDVRLNLTETQIPGGKKTAILWGYLNQYPVATVSGSDYETVSDLVNTSTTVYNPPDDNAMRSELDKIRSGLKNTHAMVTTFTYLPLTGLTSQTSPSNRSTYYSYDGLQRLDLVRDQDQNILKRFCYSYYNQTGACPDGPPSRPVRPK